MKVALVIILMSFYGHVVGQNDSIKIGSINYKVISGAPSVTIYHAECNNRPEYLFFSRLLVMHDSIMQIGYLDTYNTNLKFIIDQNNEFQIRIMPLVYK